MPMRILPRSLAPKGRTGANLFLVSPPIGRIWDRKRRGIILVRACEIILAKLEGTFFTKCTQLHA